MLSTYRPFLLFLLRFFGTYAGLSLLYGAYLSSFNAAAFEVDGFTHLVSRQSRDLIQFLGYASGIDPHPTQASYQLWVNGKYVARVVEGCNALSVVILFASFVVAFKGKWQHTLLYVLGGALLLHLANLLRIAILAVALYYYPQHEHWLHGVIFPAAIYGMVFLLWVIWVNKFSAYAKK